MYFIERGTHAIDPSEPVSSSAFGTADDDSENREQITVPY
jgi:hypothetical protein